MNYKYQLRVLEEKKSGIEKQLENLEDIYINDTNNLRYQKIRENLNNKLIEVEEDLVYLKQNVCQTCEGTGCIGEICPNCNGTGFSKPEIEFEYV